MPTFKLTIAYDGTGLVGWQRQAAGTSVQGLLEDALSVLDGREVSVTAAGRTDAGVHALGQVAGVSLNRALDAASLVRAVNARLPPAVRALSAIEVPSTFHARFDARSKTYTYFIWNADVMNPFERAYAWHVQGSLDVEAMASAAMLVQGRHDFAALQAAGSETQTTERDVYLSRVVARPGLHDTVGCHADLQGPGGALVGYEIKGNGFLRHMVRNIAGTLVEVGLGRRSPEWVDAVLASRARASAGPTAPPEGLFLVGVDYD